jgi:ferredoxin
MANNQIVFQINDNCIGCMLCVESMPAYFRLDVDTLYSIIVCQPKTNEEYRWFCEAENDCPANAIEQINKLEIT